MISVLITSAAQNELCSLSHRDACECLLSFQHGTDSAYQNLCQLTTLFCITQSVATFEPNITVRGWCRYMYIMSQMYRESLHLHALNMTQIRLQMTHSLYVLDTASSWINKWWIIITELQPLIISFQTAIKKRLCF